MTKAFAYLRVSGKSQIDRDGFTRQLMNIKSYAKAHNIDVVDVFQEKAVPGTTELRDRPALVTLLDILKVNGTKLVLIERLDRLARDLIVQETIIADFRRRGLELVSVMEPDLLRDDPDTKLRRQIYGAMAEHTKAIAVTQLRGARQRMKAATGRCEGRKPYGFRSGETDVLERMYELRQSGMSFDKIASVLNLENLVPRTPGKRWHGYSVNQILSRQEGNYEPNN